MYDNNIFLDNLDDEELFLYRRPAKRVKNKKPLNSSQLLDKAVKLMFPEQILSEETKSDFLDFIESKMETLGCVVMYKFSEDFMNICKKHKLDPEKRELVITEGSVIMFSSNYAVQPRVVA